MTTTNKTDEECLKQILDLLESRVSIETSFVIDDDTGIVTHQVLKITCGEYVTVSHPEPLEVPLQLAGIVPGTTVN